MTDKEEQALYKQATALWGVESQLDLVIEECAELIDAVQKYRRGRLLISAVGEEMTDVQNCINQFKPLFPDFEQIRGEKLQRLAWLIKRARKEANNHAMQIQS